MKRIDLYCLIVATLITTTASRADLYSVMIPAHGSALVANQLDNGGNTLDEVLAGVPDNSRLYKWNCATASWSLHIYDALTMAWVPGGTLLPGEGGMFFNPLASTLTLTFTGTPRTPVLPYLPCGCGVLQLLSRQTNGIGSFQNITGMLPTQGAQVQRWDVPSQSYVTYTYSGGAWNPAVPTASIGESVFINSPCDTNLYKWNQPPVAGAEPANVYYGWNQRSTELTYDPTGNNQAADDWVCTTTNPVTKVRWWGSFENWQGTNLPPNVAGGGFPNGFWIIFFPDVPAGMDLPFSHPAYVIMPPLARFYTNYTWRYAGRDYDPRTGTYESCFLFEQALPKTPFDGWFYQDPYPSGTNIYWLSIVANQYWGTVPPQSHFFGWKTRPRSPESPAPDDAVTYNLNAYTGGSGVPFNFQPIWWPEPTASWDLAFELITAVDTESKWAQWPDLSPMGMDVRATTNKASPLLGHLLADDFLCTNQTYLTNITIWGSLSNDFAPQVLSNITFTLSIHEDIQPGIPPFPPNPVPWSEPGAVKWWRTFTNGQYTVSTLASGLQEGWYAPPNIYLPAGDTICYQYDFHIPLEQAFFQEGTPASPRTYWLDLQAQVPGSIPQFGWKTSTNHWQDDAVWVMGGEPYDVWLGLPPWNELRHPETMESLDFAFRLNGTGAAESIKWSQRPVTYIPPDGYNGWNQYSVYGGTNIVADDWVCTNAMPVTDIHWWGSFIGWTETNLPPILPVGFVFSIWSDVPKGAGVPFSHPGICLSNIYCPAVAPIFVGWDYDPRDPLAAPDACFKFEYQLPPDQWFHQAPGTNIYWISIAAQYMQGPVVDYPWGWKTRPRAANSLAPDDAVRIFSPTAPLPGTQYGAGTNLWWPATNNSWDMAFALTTKEQCPRPTLICTNLTVECGTAWSPPYAWDNCCNVALTPALTGSVTNGQCPWVITETWLATDCQGQTNSCTRVVTVTDTTPPVINCPADKTVACGAVWFFGVPTASDTCCGTNVSIVVEFTATNGMCPWVITRQWRATDCCTNSATCKQSITLVDTLPPVITCAGNKTVECGSVWSFDEPTASDACCGTNVSISIVSTTTNGRCPWQITRTWQAVDCCTNSATCSQVVTVTDTTPPSITCSTNVVVNSSGCAPIAVNYPPATASDNCCLTNVSCVPPSGSLFPVGTSIVTCTALDCCGNSNTCTFTITVTCRAKWEQLPDLTFNGFDVRALRPKILATDFPCTKSGLITNIHIWASWLEDLPDLAASFELGFWSDVPRNPALSGELVTNGTFELAFTNAGVSGPLDLIADFIPPSWTRVETFSGNVPENSSINPIVANGPSQAGLQASAFRRSEGGNQSGDWTAVAQKLSISATQYSTLTLSLDVRVWSHNLVAGGTWPVPAYEWPAMVQVNYVDTNGAPQIWRYGWYLNPPGDGVRINDPGQGLIPIYNDQVVQQGVWVPTTFNLFNELPQVGTITQIIVGGTGWDFESDIDNVSIQGTVTNAFSRPGELLWLHYFPPPLYTWSFYPTNSQRFYDPNLGANGVLGLDTQVWEYDFPVHTNEAFRQTNGHIYWLSVSAQAQTYFGWKTAITNWNDDAVFGHVDGSWMPLSDWAELWDPYHERSLDLAFRLMTLPVLRAPVITNVWVTNTVVLGTTRQVLGLEWTLDRDMSHYQVYSAPHLGDFGAAIVWSPCGPPIAYPNHFYCETNALPSQRFYRVLGIDP